MINLLTQLSINKNKYKSKLLNVKNEILSVIYSDIIKQKSIYAIHQDIKKTITIKGIKSKKIVDYSYKLINKLKQKTNNINNILDLPLFVYNFFVKNNVYIEMKTIVYDEIKKYESKEKENILNYEFEKNRTLENPKIFYISSVHYPSAKDHENYQGVIFYDRFWRRFIKNDELKEKIENIIKEKDLKSVQWVINRPVWLITRPNCTHYFKSLSVSDVINFSNEQLIKKNNMYKEIDKNKIQTIKHSTKKDWYNITNISNIISQYQDRLNYHIALYSKNPLENLKIAIEKDKLLIKKWKAYLKNKIN